MENLDSTVLATSLPAIARSLGENPLRLNLAITAYLFSLAVFIPVSGWVADKWGARNVFRAAIALFMGGSILCGFSQSIGALVLARIVQGIGGAMMVPVGRLVVLRLVPREELVRATAFLAVPGLIGPVLGPPVGGFITTYASWRWIFWINVPIGLVGMVLVSRHIANVREENVPPLDLRGFVLAALAVTGIMAGFETVGRGLMPLAATLGALAAGVVALALYLWHERREAHPILDLSLLRIASFRAAQTGGSLFRIGVGALPFLLPMLLQLSFGLNPLQSGLITFVSAAAALGMKFLAQPILDRYGFRRVLMTTVLVSAASIAVCAAFTPATPKPLILFVLLTGGFFRSLQFTSINVIAYADVPRPRMSAATSFASTVQQLSLSVGVGLAALVLHLTVGHTTTAALAARDFVPAFLIVAAVSASAALVYRRLPLDVGRELMARTPRAREPATAVAQPPAGFED